MRKASTDEPKLLIDPNALSPDGSVAFAQWAVSPGRPLPRLRPRPGRRRLADHPRPGDRDRPRAARPDRVVPLLGHLLDEGRRGLLLCALPGAPERPGALRRPRAPPALLPPGGHAPGRRPLDLRAQGPPEVVRGRRRDRRRPHPRGLPREGSDPKNRLYYASLGDPLHPRVNAPIVPIVDEDIAEFQVIGNRGSTLFARTDLGAPKRKVHRDRHPAAAGLRGLENDRPRGEYPLEDVAIAGGRIFGGIPRGREGQGRHLLAGGQRRGRAGPPGRGHGERLSGREDGDELFYAFTSPLSPTTVYRYDIKARTAAPFEPPPAVFDVSRYETTQVFYNSKDGTRVPMFVTAKKGLVRDGGSPLWLSALRRFRGERQADLRALGLRMAGDGRRLRGAEPPRGRRVRRGVAQGGHEGEEAERLRRLHRRRRIPRPREVHLSRAARDRGRARTAASWWGRR